MSIKEIYNQGRVVGYSAYEIYVRHHMAEDPDTPPATEREWLASMIGSGASMLLKLDKNCVYKYNDEYTVYQVKLPENSTLYAANTIVGSFFTGEAEYEGHFAKYIKSYGVLASNSDTKGKHPDADETDHPMDVSSGLSLTDEQLVQLKYYANIIDGILIGRKTWELSGKSEPYMDFKPDLKEVQTIRILIRGHHDAPLNVPILLTGFTMNSILSGVASEEGSTATEHPENGDFLGPGVIPWANKIIFSIPPAYVSYFYMNAYKRKLPTSAAEITVQDTPVIDMMHTDPAKYYQGDETDDNGKPYAIPVNVTELHSNADSAAVLTVYSYQASDGHLLPPALYGTRVTPNGETMLYPLDVASPGTIKAFDFDHRVDALRLQYTIPGSRSILIDKDFMFYSMNNAGTVFPIAYTHVTKDDYHYIAHVETGNSPLHHTKTISLQDDDGNDLTLSKATDERFDSFRAYMDCDDAPQLNENPLVWDLLLYMLATDKGLDILGRQLRKLRAKLPNIDTTDIGPGVLNLSGTGESKVGGSFTAGGQITAGDDTTVKSGTQYITFKDGKRLYISDTEPTENDIPIGSIGIGWI